MCHGPLRVAASGQASESGKLFGSVTSKEIADSLAAQGITVDRKKLRIEEPIRSLGMHTVTVEIVREVSAEIKVWVVAK